MDIGGLMTTSKAKATVGLVKGIVAPNVEGYIDIMELPINGKPLGEYVNQIVELHSLLKDVSLRLDTYKIDLKRFLRERGYETEKDDLDGLFEDLGHVYTLNPNDTYHYANVHDGFITDVMEIDIEHIMRNTQIPIDIKEGYYKVEQGTLVLDEVRREEQEGLE